MNYKCKPRISHYDVSFLFKILFVLSLHSLIVSSHGAKPKKKKFRKTEGIINNEVDALLKLINFLREVSAQSQMHFCVGLSNFLRISFKYNHI